MALAEHYDTAAIDGHLDVLAAGAQGWARTPIGERVELLHELHGTIADCADWWVALAVENKLIPSGSPLEGEEWLSGPYALLSATSELIDTLTAIAAGTHLDRVSTRKLVTGQLAVQVVPGDRWDKLLMNGVTAEVWMQPGVTVADIRADAAPAYRTAVPNRRGRVAAVLGAGNIASIGPLDAYQKLFSENAVVILKMNPVNDYLTPVFQSALRPLIERDVLRIVRGDAAVGEHLCTHELVDEIHITGSEATHDIIVWGPGEEGKANKQAGTPRNTRPITSELGAICPTIVVPGPWDDSDVRFQAEHVATQKLHNNGHNCIACQALLVAPEWAAETGFLDRVDAALAAAPERGVYYPGTDDRLARFGVGYERRRNLTPDGRSDRIVVELPVGADEERSEVFGPALGIVPIRTTDPATFLHDAIAYCNTSLHGTLGANILIHPDTIDELGDRFELLLADLHYGCIAVNGWSGMGFLLTRTPWGAFPGHTLDDVGSGMGVVHNTLLLERTERTVVTGPFRPFPRGLRHGSFDLLPKPPWFVTHRRAHAVGRLLTEFRAAPGAGKLPRILVEALRG